MEHPEDSKEPKEKDRHLGEESPEEYEFLQETIKDEKTGLKKGTILKFATLGLVFGLAASLGFFAIKPWAERVFIGTPAPVTIPAEETEEPGEGDPEGQEESGEPDDGKESEKPEAQEKPEEEPAVEMPALTLDNYREMNKALYDVANEALRCVVEVISLQKEEDWQESEYDKTNSISGIIVADNGQEYLVFGSSKIAKGEDKVKVKFVDGKTCRAQVKRRDENLGFAVYAVPKANVSEKTSKKITTASLGTSGIMGQGDTVIAVGSPFGYAGAMGFGVVASPKNQIQRADGEYRLICTDITGAKSGTGALVNIKGEVIGMIDQRITDEDSMNLVTGYGISDLKQIIEMLSNGSPVPYIGIHGITVTDEIAAEQEIPLGVYVQSVDPESPAMEAGIQSGDVICGIGKEKVPTLLAFHSQLMGMKAEDEIKIKGMRKGNDGYVDITFKVTVGSCE